MVWDPHPRGPAPVPGCRLVTPNLKEAAGRTAQRLLAQWQADAVAVTLGARGAVLTRDRPARTTWVPVPPGGPGSPRS